jgi:glycine cleavage system H lipoate-binding protein
MSILEHIYDARQIEYIIATLGMFLFIVFWRVLTGRRDGKKAVGATAGNLVESVTFLAPSGVLFHPGHTWAKVESEDTVTVGMDDFAAKLLGSADSISLPKSGSRVKQGSLGWAFKSDSRVIYMLSPIEGEIVEVNEQVANSPGVAFEDPYGSGWMFKVKSSDLASNMKNMIPEDIVGQWIESTRKTLANSGKPQAAARILARTGEPIPGIARAIDPEGWDELTREFFLTK